LVKKSGVSVKQCAQGFRMLQLMKNYGIQVEDDSHGESEEIESIDYQK
jgi:hypothetical protein